MSGARGDFYTSVSTGELFGQLLAFQFAGWLEELRTAHGAGESLKPAHMTAGWPAIF